MPMNLDDASRSLEIANDLDWLARQLERQVFNETHNCREAASWREKAAFLRKLSGENHARISQ